MFPQGIFPNNDHDDNLYGICFLHRQVAKQFRIGLPNNFVGIFCEAVNRERSQIGSLDKASL